jgi:hemerythrin
MKKIEWKSTYELGIQLIDDQHKKLINIMNDVYEAQKAGTSKEIINHSLNELLEYTKYHFEAEEDLIRQHNFENMEAHIEEHNEFIEQINSFINESKAGNLVLSLKTLDYLKDWTINHILGSDKEYGEFILQKELG